MRVRLGSGGSAVSEPRTWSIEVPPEPTDVTRLVDRDGDVWLLADRDDEGGKWVCTEQGVAWSRWWDLFEYSPLTEVIG